MTAREFRNSEVARTELAEALANPRLQQALAILKAELEPLPGNDSVANPVTGAARFQQIAGANHIILGLEALTTPQPQRVPLRGRTLIDDPIRES